MIMTVTVAMEMTVTVTVTEKQDKHNTILNQEPISIYSCLGHYKLRYQAPPKNL